MNPAMSASPEQYVYTQPDQTPPKPQAPVTPGRLRQAGLDESNRNITTLMHLSLPVGFVFSMGPFAILLPLVFWLIYRSKSDFINDHGREVINFGLSMMLFSLLVVTIPFVVILLIVSTIRAAMASHRSEYFRYPMTIRFLK